MRPAVILFALALAACSGPDAGSGNTPPPPSPDVAPGRITVQRIKTVPDSEAYSGHRGVYVIRDNLTGREYIGYALLSRCLVSVTDAEMKAVA